MSHIEFEDRTTESTEGAVHRHVEEVSRAIIGTTILASQGSPSVGMAALIMAVGVGAARTGASLDQVIEAIKSAYDKALEHIDSRKMPRPADG